MILVTGGAGFIGSVLIKELNKLGRKDILIVDRLMSDEKWKNLRHLKYDDFIHADDLFLEDSSEFWEQLSCIYHMGACSSTTERDVDFLMKNNVDYSKELFRAATNLNIPFLYASSAATYGNGEQGYSDDHDLIDSLLPMNAYGYSKQVMDQWALKQEQTPPIWFGLKFFNVFGPNEYHKDDMRSLACKAFDQIHETGEVKLFKSYKEGFKDGHQLRDFVYVKDIARAMILMSEKKEGQGIYNLGKGKANSFYEFVVSVFKSLDLEANIKYIEMPESLRGQYQYFTEAKMDKFHKLCPEFQFTELSEAVSDYVKEHLNKKEDPYY